MGGGGCTTAIRRSDRVHLGNEAFGGICVVGVLGCDGCLTGTSDLRDRDGRNNGDNRDDNQKLNQAESRVELWFECGVFFHNEASIRPAGEVAQFSGSGVFGEGFPVGAGGAYRRRLRLEFER